MKDDSKSVQSTASKRKHNVKISVMNKKLLGQNMQDTKAMKDKFKTQDPMALLN